MISGQINTQKICHQKYELLIGRLGTENKLPIDAEIVLYFTVIYCVQIYIYVYTYILCNKLVVR